jgi:hypothetical protein
MWRVYAILAKPAIIKVIYVKGVWAPNSVILLLIGIQMEKSKL